MPGCSTGVSGGKATISLKLTAETSKQTALMKKATSKRPPRPRPPVTPPDPPPSLESGLDNEMLHRSPSPQRSYSGHSQRSSRSPSPPSHRRRYSGAREDTGRGRSRSPSARTSRRGAVGHRTRSRTPPGGGRERGGSRRDPRDKSQLVAWNNPVVILGEKVRNAVFHFCDECDRPILIYGRMIPCKHVFCLPCSTHAQQDPKQSCPRCSDKINRLEKCTIGSIYMCHYGGTQNGYTGCRRTYLSQRDLQAHVDTRHTKTASAVPARAPPPVSQQAAAIAAVAAAVGPPAPNTAIRPPPPLGSVPNPSLPPNAVRPPMTAAGFVNPPPVLASTAFPPPMRPPPTSAAAVAAANSFNNPQGGMGPRPPQGTIFSSAPPGLVANQPGMQAPGGNGQPNWQARPPRPPF